MIRKLRIKIIMLNVIMTGAILAIVLSFLCINSYNSSVRTLEISLRSTLDNIRGGIVTPPIGEAIPDNKNNRYDKMNSNLPCVCVTLDSDGNIIKIDEINATISEETLSLLVDDLKTETKKTGLLNKNKLMYYIQTTPEGLKIAFADASSIYAGTQNSILLTVVVFIGCIAVFILINFVLSGMMINPVKKAWIQQKQFIADASHELKTPLTVILANNNILMSHKNESLSSQEQWLESTDEEAKHMKKLIDQMLELAKTEEDQRTILREKIDLSELLEGISLYFEPVAYEKGVILECEITKNCITLGDKTMLNQLFQILTDNAIKYATKKSTITIKLANTQGIEFTVNNKGEVISQEDLPHIFDRFYRADKSRSSTGYGLGLAIAKSIADQMKIKISVTSNQTEGTTFKLKF